MPLSISVEPSGICNLKCPECPSGLQQLSREKGLMQFDLFKKAIDELYQNLIYLLLYFQGEPYLNKNFFDFVKYAASKKIYTSTSTNGHFLDKNNCIKTIESGLDKLIISLDGTTQDSYSAYRKGGDLKKVIEGIENLVNIKRSMKSPTPHIVIQFLVLGSNESEISIARQLSKNLGVDEFSLKSAQIYNYENGNDLIPTIDKYSRYRKTKNGRFEIKNKLKNKCWKMWSSAVITWDGYVVPCCFDKDSTYTLGNLNENSFIEIWKNAKANVFRNKILKLRKEIDICKNCSE
ncbi:MAG: radical SAM/SPASM domain-containing protein [Bacteroidota bacterium]|nr:radical SAM/SPASM domain-containing protein [Bacteroidota bacterium]